MSQSQQWVELDSVVIGYLDQSEQSQSKYMKLWNIAYRGMSKCGLDCFYAVKSVLLPINANQTCSFPPDYLQYTKIGVLNGMGEVSTLKRNNNISKIASQLNSRQAINDSEFLYPYDPYSFDYYNYAYGNGFCNVYGLPTNGNANGFTIDEGAGLILLNGIWDNGSIVLEYIPSPNPDEAYKIPIQFEDAIMWYMAWHDIAMIPTSRRGNLGDRQQRKQNFFNERRLAIRSYRPFRIEDARDLSVAAQRLVVKS